jgi:endonuclease YncB( thermonuclease family)
MRVALLFLAATQAQPAAAGTQQAAAPVYPGPILAEAVRVVDGDTVRVRAHVWPDHVIETAVRLVGIDAPELSGRCAAERRVAARARDRLRALVAEAGGRLWLHDVALGTYAGRVLGRLVTPDGRDLGQALRAAGLAVAYERRADQRTRLCGGE